MRLVLWLCVSAVLAAADGRRFGGGGSKRIPSPKRPPAQSPPRRTEFRPPSPPDTSVNNHFLNSERGTASGNTHNRPNPFSNPSPQVPQPHTPIGFDKVNSPSAPKAPTVQTNGPLGFDKVNGAGNQQGSHQIGFDKVNSEANKRVPSAPPYPNGPPPAYHPTGNSYSGAGAADHPPSYPGRPINAPPSYSANHPYNPQPGNYPNQQHPYPAQGFAGTYPQQNQFPGAGYGAYPQGGSYPSNTGYFPASSGHYPHGAPYQGNTYGGSPFGNTGYNGNPYYNPSNFGYSSNPGYFGSQGGYSNYPGQFNSQQKTSRFGGLPIPIPIPIPIPLGGFGGFGGFSQNHRLLDSFIKKKENVTAAGNSTTSVFILNNSTVTPCTTDHFVYDLLKVSVVSCTAEHCTAVKLYATTNVSGVVSVHSAGLTMCMEDNVTLSHYGDKVTPTVSEMLWQNVTVCRDVANTTVAASNVTVSGINTTAEASNATVAANTVTALDGNGTEATPTTTVTEDPTTTIMPATTNQSLAANMNESLAANTNQSLAVNTTKVCERVDCASVELCLPSIEVMDPCTAPDCPFRRTGFKPCVTLKMCRSPSTPVSSFATLNTTISKIDEFNNYNSKFDAANLTLISYHRPVIRFDCPLNATAPGCPPPTNSSASVTPAAVKL